MVEKFRIVGILFSSTNDNLMYLRAIIFLGSMVSTLFFASCGDSQEGTDTEIQVDQDIIGDPIEGEEIVGEPILSGNATTWSGDDDNLTVIEEGLVANGKRFPLEGNNSSVEEFGELPPLEEGSEYTPLSFRLLQEFDYNVEWERDGKEFDFSAYAERVPESVRQQSGAKIAVEGFMIPTIVDENNLVKEFLLLPDQMSCCFGQTPEANGWVVVAASEGVDVLMDRIIRVTGILVVEERWDEEFFVGLYHMDCQDITGPAL